MRALILDFDGVIADSEPSHEVSIREALAAAGIPLSHDDFTAQCLGVGDRACFRRLGEGAGKPLTEPRIDELMAIKRIAFTREVSSGSVRPYPGTLGLIAAAAERLPLAVCSGSTRHTVETVLRTFDLIRFFGAVITSDDVPATKPDPAGYTLAAARLAVGPARCVAVEDTPTGIAAARAAGMRVAAVCHTLPADRLREAHRVFDSTASLTLDDLLAL